MSTQLELNPYAEAQDAVNLFLKQCKLSGLDARLPTRMGRHEGYLGWVGKKITQVDIYGIERERHQWIKMSQDNDGSFSMWGNDLYQEWEFKDVYEMLKKANEIIQEWL